MSAEPPSRSSFRSAYAADDSSLLDPPTALRIGMLVFGGVLALGGALMLLCALLLPRAIALPLDKESADAAAAYRVRAFVASRLGAVRGDLFAQAAFTDAKLLGLDRSRAISGAVAAEVRRARANAETSLALAPINGAAWFFLAAVAPASARGDDQAGLVPLQMSYFTAPSDPILARPRIERALASAAPIDKDMQEFMKGDLRVVLARQPEEKSALLAAYRTATPQNRAIFEALAAEADPDFGQAVRNGSPK